jgi:hypothetical protein
VNKKPVFPGFFDAIDEAAALGHHQPRTENGRSVMARKNRKRRSPPVITSAKQRERLAAIRRFLAEEGYQIYPVALWYRRSRHDFLALPRQQPNVLLLVRPAHGRIIEVRYYAYRGSYARIREALRRRRAAFGPIRWGRQLPAKDLRNDWRRYIARQCRLELQLFTDAGRAER